jgi:lysophospholipase L1-like esterase
MSPPTSSPVRGSRLALTGAIVGVVVGGLAAGRVALDVAAARRAGRAWREFDHRATVPGEPPALRLVVLGDSAAAGHGLSDAIEALPWQLGSRLARRTGRAVEVAGHARSGADTDDVAAQVPQVTGAEAVVIGVGVNDALAPRRRIGDVHAGTARLLDAVRARAPRARVVLLACPDLGDAPGVPRALRPVVRWRCRAVAGAQTRAAAGAGVSVVAVDGPLPAGVFGADGLHPSAAAVERLAELTLPALVEDEGA